MWATLYLTIDARLMCKREIWLTAARGYSSRQKRLTTIEEATQLLKRRYSGPLATCDSYEITMQIESRVNEVIKNIPLPVQGETSKN